MCFSSWRSRKSLNCSVGVLGCITHRAVIFDKHIVIRCAVPGRTEPETLFRLFNMQLPEQLNTVFGNSYNRPFTTFSSLSMTYLTMLSKSFAGSREKT
jgi:hypothetical protein